MSDQRAAGDGGRRVVEVEARTVDEAVARGLVRLGGLSRAEVKIEVLSEGRGGVLGIGAELARVRLTELLPGEEPEDVAATGPQPEPEVDEGEAAGADEEVEEEEPAEKKPRRARAPKRKSAVKREPAEDEPVSRAEVAVADADAEAVSREVVGSLLELLGYDGASLEATGTLLPEPVEGETSLVLTISGGGAQRLLADDARALLALQFLARLIIGRRLDSWVNLLLDVEGDRVRRMKELYDLAEESAVLAEKEGHPVSLPPMTPYERRVVHLALRKHPTVATQSIGSGDLRKVTVRRKDQLLPEL